MPAKEPKRGMMAKGYLGDWIAKGLESIGITPERVEKWLGVPCGCKERREKLNNLHRAVERIYSGKTENMQDHMQSLMDEESSRDGEGKDTK